jgi:hypothetical protein
MNQVEKLLAISALAGVCEAEQNKRSLEMGENFSEDQAQLIATEVVKNLFSEDNILAVDVLVSNAFDKVLGETADVDAP